MADGVVKTDGGWVGHAPPGFIGIFTYRPGNRFAGPRGWVMALRAIALITPAPSGAAATAKPAAGQAKRPNVKAAQALAKQKALEKKAKNYKPPLGELALFTQQLASLLNAGLPLVQCLEALQDQTEDPCFRILIRDVRLDISSGNSFSAAVKKFPKSFPSLFISIEIGRAHV